ncbi:Crp/Fnr family transcriptional regulator [Pelagibius sp.]|uniref:Crp/Fnr family transcriptional regulator n=1 Tax=Pelagibius sp. TaxID=1931238 RepID=UPI00262EA198|nr:Crp/Fnr family transcriptional regulator [Pelagibius sp.]
MAEDQPDKDRRSSALAYSDLIGDLSAESLGHLGSVAERVRLGRNSVLFFQDDPGDAIYVVEKGSVEISITSPSGKKLSLNVMRPPDVFGEIAALDGGPRTATAICMEDTTLLRFGGKKLRVAMLNRPEVGVNLIAILCARLRWVSQQVEDLAIRNLEGRLARRLLILHHKFSDETGSLRFSQSELADFLGATRESTNKTLQGWRSRGLITLSRGSIRIRNLDGLADLATLE